MLEREENKEVLDMLNSVLASTSFMWWHFLLIFIHGHIVSSNRRFGCIQQSHGRVIVWKR